MILEITTCSGKKHLLKVDNPDNLNETKLFEETVSDILSGVWVINKDFNAIMVNNIESITKYNQAL